MNTPDHEKLQLDGTEEPDFQKTLDCHGDLQNLCGRSRQRSNPDDECFCGIAIFDLARVNGGVASLFPVHAARPARANGNNQLRRQNLRRRAFSNLSGPLSNTFVVRAAFRSC